MNQKKLDDYINLGLIGASEGLYSLEDFAVFMALLGSTTNLDDLDELFRKTLKISTSVFKQLKTIANTAPEDQVFTTSSNTQPSPPALGEKTEPIQLSELKTYEQLDSRYILGDEIGRGGSGVVRLVFDQYLGRTVALKTLLDPIADSQDMVQRFLGEAQATGQLEHSSIIPVYDLGKLSNGSHFYTMKYVGGSNLRRILNGLRVRYPEVIKEYGMVRMLNIHQQLCMALHYSHTKGVIHRDIKPENIMLGEFGEVVIMDWGLAKITGNDVRTSRSENVVSTQFGEILGTPEYMSPEQARGLNEDLDSRSDVYSLGVILYEILALQPPFLGDKPLAMLNRIINEEIVPPSQVAPERRIPPELETITMKALEKDRDHRYQNARELHDAITEYLENSRQLEIDQKNASKQMELGRKMLKRYVELRTIAKQAKQKAETEARTLRGWENWEVKQSVWDLQDRAGQKSIEVIEAFSRAEQAFQQALAYNPEHPDARKGLAALYWSRFVEAERTGQPESTFYHRKRLEEYDDGTYLSLLEADGSVAITAEPEAECSVCKLEEKNRILQKSEESYIGSGSIPSLTLPAGSYLFVFRKYGTNELRIPAKVVRGEKTQITCSMLPPQIIGDGFLQIPGGEFEVGGDLNAPGSLPCTFHRVEPFLIGRYPVTFGEYLEFINSIYHADPEQAISHLPRTRGQGHLCIQTKEGAFEPGHRLINGGARKRYPPGEGYEWFLPVVGINIFDVYAYIEWRNHNEQCTYRLPTEIEWELTARGVDGRLFPWGNHFDPTFCKTCNSRKEPSQPEPVGIFETDCSVYGVHDLAGGIREWTESFVDTNQFSEATVPNLSSATAAYIDDSWANPEEDQQNQSERVVRGGSWALTKHFSRCAARSFLLPNQRLPDVGLRLVKAFEG